MAVVPRRPFGADANHPGIDRVTAEADALKTAGALVEAGIAVPTLAPRDDLARAADDGSLTGLPD